MFKFDNAFHTVNKHVGMQFRDTHDKNRVATVYPNKKGQLEMDCSGSPLTPQEAQDVVVSYNKRVVHYAS